LRICCTVHERKCGEHGIEKWKESLRKRNGKKSRENEEDETLKCREGEEEGKEIEASGSEKE